MLPGNNAWGVWRSYDESNIKSTDLTLGSLMQQSGYHTAFFGKWHLGCDFSRLSQPGTIYRSPRMPPELDVDIREMVKGPQQFGFDYDFTFPAGIQDVPYAAFENGDWFPLGDDSEIILITQKRMDSLNAILDKDEGLGDSNWDPHNMGPLLAYKAVDDINSRVGTNQLFFIYYCSLAFHVPHAPPDSINGKASACTAPSDHLSMIKELDQQVGMMIQALKDNGIYDNTVIVFTSDNVGLRWSPGTAESGHNSSDIYRGQKSSKYEGGHRVPFIVSYPDSIAPGQISDELVVSLDIMHTLARMTNLEILSHQAMDSYDLWPLLKGEKQARGHELLMIQSGYERCGILIEGGWKLIIEIDPDDNTNNTRYPLDLFNLETNVREIEDLNLIDMDASSELVDFMFQRYNLLWDSKTPTYNLKHEEISLIQEPRKLLVFPNPATDELIIFLPEEKNNPVTINVYSLDGSPILCVRAVNTMVINNSILIDISEIPDGCYIIELRTSVSRQVGSFIKS